MTQKKDTPPVPVEQSTDHLELLDTMDPEDIRPPPLITKLVPLPQDLESPQLTVRAIVSGILLGSLLSLCNIYAGLKVGWSFNMSIIAVLISYGFWQMMAKHAGTAAWGLLENNTSQTTASSAASISSAGLVTAIPALTILTGHHLSWLQLSVWTLSVCLVGVFVGAGLRRQMLLRDPLPFPAGVATAVTLKDMYAHDDGAKRRIRYLLTASGIAGAWLLLHTYVLPFKKLYINIALPFLGKLKAAGVAVFTTTHLGWGLDPSLLLVGTGALVGIRVAASLFFGTIVAWGILAPIALHQGWAYPSTGHHDVTWYGSTVKWLLWPGVAIMVSSSLTSIAFSWRSVLEALKPLKQSADADQDAPDAYGEAPSTLVPRSVFASGMGVALVISVICQFFFFGIAIWMGVLSVLMTFFLAIVAARVSGVTGITPKGALGKVTQLTFGGLSPGHVEPNLMAANVTAGAAAQAADILHDLKAGNLLGASPRIQLIGQLFGIVAGAFVGSAAYLMLIPDPKTMLLTPEWPAPAVAVWKSVAEIFKIGFSAMPTGALLACGIGLVLGCIMAIIHKKVAAPKRKWMPDPAALGLAFVLPASASTAIFLGGLLLVIARVVSSEWTERYTLAIAAGLIAGESLFGIFTSVLKMIGS